MELNKIAVDHFRWVEEMGWHNNTDLESIALIGSEIGEATAECFGDTPTAAFAEELADIILRVSDLAQVHGLDLEAAVAEVSVTWRANSLGVRLRELFVEFSEWVNTARGATRGPDFVAGMARLALRVIQLAESQGANLTDAIEKKMAVNRMRGTRGRLV